MRTTTSLVLLCLAGCGAAANQAWRAENNAKTQAAMAQCDAGLEQHTAYMRTTPPKAASGDVAEAWNVQQEAKIQAVHKACSPAMRAGLDAKWFVLEVRQGEAYEKLMAELAGFYDAVPAKEKPDVLRRLIDAVVQSKAHYGFAIDNVKSDPAIVAQNSGMHAKAQAKVTELETKYTALKAVQAKQYE